MNYQSVAVANCIDGTLCEISSNYVNSLMYGLCNVSLYNVKLILLIEFLIASECETYTVRCLLEKINCP